MKLTRENLSSVLLILITALLITVTGILFNQSVLRIIPLYVSLIVGMLQSRANRYASLLGGCNSLLYALAFLYLGLYASAGSALLFSCPVQLITFVRWSKNRYGNSTRFCKLSNKQRFFVAGAFLLCFIILFFALKASGSSYQFLDNLSSLMGILIELLKMLAFIEYSWLMLPSGMLSIILNLATMRDNPEQITYVIYSIYSLICIFRQFFRVRKLYRIQQTEAA